MAIALQDLWQHLQRQLFPTLVEELGELGEKDHEFVRVVSLLPLGKFLEPYRWKGIGCPPHERAWLVHAYIAKGVYQFSTTEAVVVALKTNPTLRRLCGWEKASDVPSVSTFSRAFAQFAADELPQKVHEALVKLHCGPKLVGHTSHDATAVSVPERPPAPAVPAAAATAEPGVRRKRGRPKKGQEPPPPPPTRLQLQPRRSLAENLADLPRACDIGAKKGSKGHMEYWRGYKLHLSVIDGDIPISAILTSASTHDSQVAIPLMQMSAQRVTDLYDLMDSAYDAEAIHECSRGLGHIPLIDIHPRRDAALREELQAEKKRRQRLSFNYAEAVRFRERTTVERVNARLKDEFGGRMIRVRGHAKVICHLMFGILALAADQILRLVT